MVFIKFTATMQSQVGQQGRQRAPGSRASDQPEVEQQKMNSSQEEDTLLLYNKMPGMSQQVHF